MKTVSDVRLAIARYQAEHDGVPPASVVMTDEDFAAMLDDARTYAYFRGGEFDATADAVKIAGVTVRRLAPRVIVA